MLKRLATWDWWRGSLERAGSQVIETVLAIIVVGAALVPDIDVKVVVGVALGGALMSLLMSIVSLPENDAEPVPLWQALFWRIVRTAAAALIGVILAAVGNSTFNALAFDWGAAFSVAGTTVLVAVLKSLAIKPPEAIAQT